MTSIAIATGLAVGGTSSVITETGLVNPDGTNNVAFGGSPHPRVASPGNVPAAGYGVNNGADVDILKDKRLAEVRGQMIPQPAGVAAGIRPPVADENSRHRAGYF